MSQHQREFVDDSRRFSFGHFYRKHFVTHLNCLERIQVPSLVKITSWLLITGLLVAFVMMWLPWVQTTSGMGRVTTMNPGDRVQNINALVSGRIAQWYVQDADVVQAGDPIALIQDIDSDLVPRLQSQLEAASRRLEASREALQTAEIDYERRQNLFDDGLASRLDMEQARIRVQERRIALEEALANLNQAEVNLSRQGSQLVTAPRDGTILSVEAGDAATLVTAGQALATFMPANADRVVELFLDGRDIGLVFPGRNVRMQFEGWPAFQFTGIPEIAVGTFAGEVLFVEPSARADGRFRVIVREVPTQGNCARATISGGLPRNTDCSWPPESFVRLGANVRGWVQLETVPLGYELWRLMNNFPPMSVPPMVNQTSQGNSQ